MDDHQWSKIFLKKRTVVVISQDNNEYYKDAIITPNFPKERITLEVI
jgi:hypothetical protein